jgi:hypothetical protein
MGRDNNPVAQSDHSENVERMCLASLVAILTDTPGSQLKFSNPQSTSQALSIRMAVTEAEKQ